MITGGTYVSKVRRNGLLRLGGEEELERHNPRRLHVRAVCAGSAEEMSCIRGFRRNHPFVLADKGTKSEATEAQTEGGRAPLATA